MDADIPTDHPPTQSFAPPPRNVRLRDWAQDQRVIAAMAIGVLALVSLFSLPQVFARWYATSFGSPVQATVRYRYRAEPTEHHSRYRMQFEYSQGGQDFTQTDEIGQPQFENLDLGSPLPGKAAHLLGADYCYTGLDRSENINMPRAQGNRI